MVILSGADRPEGEGKGAASPGGGMGVHKSLDGPAEIVWWSVCINIFLPGFSDEQNFKI